MLIIDKAQNINEMVCTISEVSLPQYPNYALMLFNLFTNVEYVFPVVLTSSNDRYDVIKVILTNEINGAQLIAGTYQYSIYQNLTIAYPLSTEHLLETGLLKVIDAVDVIADENQFISLPTTGTEDDYIVYKS